MAKYTEYKAPQDQRVAAYCTRTLVSPEDDNDVVQMVARASAAGGRARPIVLDEDNEDKIAGATMLAVWQVDIQILQGPAVLPVPPRLVDWYVQQLPVPWWRAASNRRRRKRVGRARAGAESPLPLPAEEAMVTVRDASLTRLALAVSPATAFAYNLSLTLTVRNKNWAMSVRNTKPLEARYSFDGQPFERIRLAEEGSTQPAGDTQVYHLVSGEEGRYVALGNAGVAEFKAESATGMFKVEVAVSGEVRYQAHYTKCKFEAKCPLVLQLAPPGTPAVVFQEVKCKPVTADKNC
ncbi:hypothetical protein TRIUR3_05827 [Triticum urartu]|uniref:Uncharacterized protein n=1 Tax=Triticum urartu TaxID=4572 RepID=M7ZEF1_TRIUA|nr:hypothetical protein TRIUR3_05827 [Triticum urartu]